VIVRLYDDEEKALEAVQAGDAQAYLARTRSPGTSSPAGT
jgi:hypothetical protein